ncbi:MAG: SDR family oxidoreductase [Burkholderiaceae bacterium]
MHSPSESLEAALAEPARTLPDRVVLITGGARGLGAALAEVLGGAGARIALVDRDMDGAQNVARRLSERGIEASAHELDVGDEAQVRECLGVLQRRYGALDVVINNAGVDVTAPISELSSEDWERIVRTNLTGPFLMAKQALTVMTRGGHIVNICSTAAKRSWPNASAYHASKWGLLGLSHALHAELRGAGIKVTAVVAGGMRTPFLLERFPDLDPQLLQDPLDVARTVRFVLTQPAATVIPEVMVLPMRETSWP